MYREAPSPEERPCCGQRSGEDVEIDAATPTSVTEFRRALAEWLDANLTPEVVEAGREGFEDERTLELLRGWNRALADAGWAAVAWPAEYGGRDAGVAEQLAYLEVMSRGRGARAAERHRGGQHRAGHPRGRNPGAEGPLPRPDAPWGRDLVPGHVRARRRIGPGLAAHLGGGRRRRVRDQRPEDVEQPRPPCRLVPALRSHRSVGPQARRHQLPARRYAVTRDRSPPAPHHDR